MLDLMNRVLRNILVPFGEEYRDITNGIFLAFLTIAWLFIVGTTVERIREYDPITLVRVLTLIGATVGVYVAVWKLLADQKWRRSEVYLEQAKELLEKSFNALEIDPATGYPFNSRKCWLSSSRLLLAALALGKKISEPNQKETLREYFEYWRMQFRELLDLEGPRAPDEHYFYETGAIHAWSPRTRAPIAERSVAVLYRFMDWPEEREDRLAQETDFTEQEIERMEKFGAEGVATYCRRRRERS